MPIAGPRLRVEKYRDLLARIHALPRRRLTLMIGVDGPRGAGKTTFTRALAALDPGLDVVQMDDFWLPRGQRRQERGEAPVHEVAADVDWRRLRAHVLMPLSRDQPARYQRYDWTRDSLAEWRMVPVGGILIVEGLYACSRPLAGFYDFKIWVEAPLEVRRSRGPGRDGEGEERWHRLLAEDAYLAAQDPAARADLRVDGSGSLPHDPLREYVRIRDESGRG
ncbi:MAG TPA: uridine kinase [Candidatus Dormibacteraeota bacterium]|nr:uridine kinase [Candidatus Dormibacteraeota bacterium]